MVEGFVTCMHAAAAVMLLGAACLQLCSLAVYSDHGI